VLFRSFRRYAATLDALRPKPPATAAVGQTK
jgi:hypothetical protein